MPRSAVPFETVAEMLKQLGGIDPGRVRSWPPPGKATEKDVLRILDHENRLYELVDGVLVEKVMGLMESALGIEIGTRVANCVNQSDLGIVAGADGTLEIMPRLVRIPDVSFISWNQLPKREYPAEPIPMLYPDLAVEVPSEANTAEEMRRKVREYFFAGTRLVWLVDPDTRTVRVYTAPEEPTVLTEADTLDGGEVLPGFSLSLKQLFARVPRTSRRRPTNGKRSPKKRRRA
jgi:Uma2 family endonuclease